ncbi:TetR/AcrR family transcriptional regulator [Polymorphum gilvum]|uniref:Transcriptional regulator, TetR family protein n=1 Tax=Polymorphum gilvum (strain LMG 25793 / CGMCC 1.9160 / SL003B-26A1) TaxID=991905 RepID=F2J4A0_POLGS|nr:TetR/AcrR family transcriptional regulator [Polymorphum gilvum]ADZ71042.1 Transcriptional regulator, TetR family protein [Polymorphum gilvum SL003B-26A1]
MSVSPSFRPAAPAAGRPRQRRVTDALLSAALAEFARHGLDGARIETIARTARTSKQAIYRRWPDKTTLFSAALDHAFAGSRPDPAQRLSAAADLDRFVRGRIEVLTATSLGPAFVQALASRPQVKAVLDGVEEDWRLTLRQMLVGTAFEAGMETRIDLVLGYVHRCLVAERRPSDVEIETAVHLVLGLMPPRRPPGCR